MYFGWLSTPLTGQLQMASLSLHCQSGTNLMLNCKVIELLLQLKCSKDHGKNYIKVKPHLVRHQLQNNQLQNQVKEELRVETQASWEKFCKSISLETDPSESWCKIENFLKPNGQLDYQTLQHEDKVAKTNADKGQFFVESAERYFGIESEHFDSNHFNEVNNTLYKLSAVPVRICSTHEDMYYR